MIAFPQPPQREDSCNSEEAGNREVQSAQVSQSERERAIELAAYFTSTSVAPGPNAPRFDAPRLPPDPTLVALSQLGALKLDCNRSFISLIDRNHQYIISEATKSNSLVVPGRHAPSDGIYLGFSALELSFGVCPQTIQIFTTPDRTIDTPNITANGSRYVIRDFCSDQHFSNRPYVTGWPYMRSYAEVPLTSVSGAVIGSYCVVDDKPRAFEDGEISVLHEIASTIMNHLDLLKTKFEHDRLERLVRGLGSYVNGAANLEPQQPTLFRNLSRLKPSSAEGALLTKPSSSRHSSRIGTTSPNSVASQSYATSPPNTLDTPFTGPGSDLESIPRQNSPVHNSWPLSKEEHSDQASIVAESVRKTFARAGNIIRQAMDMQNVMFLDPSLHDPGNVSASWTRPQLHDKRRASVSESMFEKHTCGVLAYSTDMEISLHHGGPPFESPHISQGLLERMLLRYPFGHVVSADEYGVLSTPRVVRGFPNGDGFAQYDLNSRTAAEDSREADDVTELFQSLPSASSVVFLPIWNFQKRSWFSVIVGWTRDPVRIFNAGDLDYLSAFGNSIMAEVSRIEASALSRAKSDFISSISHELRSPLHGILAGTELLRDSMTQVSESSMLNNIDACGNMLLDTMNHLLDYAKINSLTNEGQAGSNAVFTYGSSETQKRTSVADLGELVQDVVDGVLLGHSAKQMPVEIATSPDLGRRANEVVILIDIEPSVNWRFETELGAWKRIVMNLVGNALKYTDRGQINVRLFLHGALDEQLPSVEPEKHICIQVTDTGRGMSTDYLRHGLFKPFAQENNLSPGTGLGLSIVHRLVESLNGTINVQSKLGVGTRIEVLIPPGEKTRIAHDKVSMKKRNVGGNLDPEGLLRGRTLFLPAVSAVGLSKVSSVSDDGLPPSANLAVRALLASIAQDWLDMKVVENDRANPNNDGGSADFFALLPNLTQDGSLGPCWTLRKPLLSHKGVVPEKDASRGPIFAETIIHSPFSPRNVAMAFLDARDSQIVLKPSIKPPNAMAFERPIDGVALAKGEAAKTPIPEDSFGNPTEIVTLNIPDRTAQGTLSSTSKGHQNHVLLVDDNTINLNILSKVVQKAGCSFVKVPDGLQAVEAFSKTTTPFDLILMDLSMPVMDGFTATRQIRGHERRTYGPSRRTRIVALTALASATSRDEAFASGIDMFLPKPVPMKEVRELVMQNFRA